MPAIAFDTETELIEEHTPIPRLVCSTFAGEMGDIFSYQDTPSMFRAVASDPDMTLVAHHATYDLCVLGKHDPSLMPLIFTLLDFKRIKDTKIREALARIEEGTLKEDGKGQSMSLEALSRKYLNTQLDKGEDGWRLRYGELRDLPLSEWPERARKYAIDDAISTHKIFEIQQDKPDEYIHVRADYALSLASAHGLMTDPVAVKDFEASLKRNIAELKGDLEHVGILKADGSRDTKKTRALIEESFARKGITPPKTEPSSRFANGQIKYDEETLKESGDPVLQTLARYSHLEKLLTTYVPLVQKGTERPIHGSYNVLLATGRTSAFNPNWQNLPREKGARECVIPRPGFVFVTCDYDVAELRGLAQVCYTWFKDRHLQKWLSTSDDPKHAALKRWTNSYEYEKAVREDIELGNAFKAGRDPHLELASAISGRSYEDLLQNKTTKEVKDLRQLSKAGNFGISGGLGAIKFQQYAKGFDVFLTEQEARQLKQAWLNKWKEMGAYFKVIGLLTGETGPKCIQQLFSNRIRGNVTFTQAANSPFQGIVADMAKSAFYEVTKKCYIDRRSNLYECRPVAFLHDEILIEAPEDRAHEAALELEKVMVEIGNEWLPDIGCKASADAMRRWSKMAKPVFKNGRLIPWEDQ